MQRLLPTRSSLDSQYSSNKLNLPQLLVNLIHHRQMLHLTLASSPLDFSVILAGMLGLPVCRTQPRLRVPQL
jgi:hypothetical protein